jgi:hypothetical protein
MKDMLHAHRSRNGNYRMPAVISRMFSKLVHSHHSMFALMSTHDCGWANSKEVVCTGTADTLNQHTPGRILLVSFLYKKGQTLL